jgi:hypothetical protein
MLKLLIMKKKLHDQFTMLGSNSRRWIVSSKTPKASQFFIVLLTFLATAFSAAAQETNTRSAEMSRTAKSSENSATATASELQLNANRPAELDEFEAKINTLLTLVRAALVVESNAAKFHENLEQSIRMKSEQVCSSIALMDLIKGTAPFTASPESGKQELNYAVDFLSVVLNELSAK